MEKAELDKFITDWINKKINSTEHKILNEYKEYISRKLSLENDIKRLKNNVIQPINKEVLEFYGWEKYEFIGFPLNYSIFRKNDKYIRWYMYSYGVAKVHSNNGKMNSPYKLYENKPGINNIEELNKYSDDESNN